jgi:hypothetical protein
MTLINKRASFVVLFNDADAMDVCVMLPGISLPQAGNILRITVLSPSYTYLLPGSTYLTANGYLYSITVNNVGMPQ